jgi:nucleoside-diphosphate-sugar epimerase
VTSRVLVLGAGGFLGQHIRRELDSRGLKTVGTGRTARPGVDHVIDLAGATQHELDRLISAIDPDAVVNCAGATYGSVADLNRGNVVAVHALLSSLAWSAPTARLVHLGSAAEYGGCPHGQSMAEDFDPRPGGAYGYTKLAGTTMVLRAREQGFDAVVLRAFNVIGPGSPFSTLLGRTVSQLRAGSAVRLGPLDTWRDFVDVRDVARAVAAAVGTDDLPPVLNVGRGEAVHCRRVVDLLVSASGTGATVVEEDAEHATHAGSPAATVAWQQADLTTVTSRLGWSPSIDAETSVRDTWLTA